MIRSVQLATGGAFAAGVLNLDRKLQTQCEYNSGQLHTTRAEEYGSNSLISPRQSLFTQVSHHCKQNIVLEYAQVVFNSGTFIPASKLTDEAVYFPAHTNHEGLGMCKLLFYRDDEFSPTSKLETRDKIQTEIESSQNRALEHPHGVRPMELTRRGQMQAIALGKRLRNRYRTFLIPSNWTMACNRLITSRTLLMENCVDTLNGVISGLFETSIPSDAAAVVSVRHLKDKETEWFQAFVGPSSSEILKAAFTSAIERKATEINKQTRACTLFGSATSLLGTKGSWDAASTNPYIFVELRRHLSCIDSPGDTYGEKVEQTEKDLNQLASSLMYEGLTGGSESNRIMTCRLLIGKFVRKLIETLESDTLPQRLDLISTDDITLMALYTCLDPYGKAADRTRIWPRGCADVTFEVWREQESNLKLVRILLNGKPFRLPGIPCSTGGEFYDIDTLKYTFREYSESAE
mmetsp:Transcript_4300/g.5749  ORF Transcript_4300/g.5749 Transcript_4300/m.5749 type:complete len:463 (+) Transcript_4300:268-1656(+)